MLSGEETRERVAREVRPVGGLALGRCWWWCSHWRRRRRRGLANESRDFRTFVNPWRRRRQQELVQDEGAHVSTGQAKGEHSQKAKQNRQPRSSLWRRITCAAVLWRSAPLAISPPRQYLPALARGLTDGLSSL